MKRPNGESRLVRRLGWGKALFHDGLPTETEEDVLGSPSWWNGSAAGPPKTSGSQGPIEDHVASLFQKPYTLPVGTPDPMELLEQTSPLKQLQQVNFSWHDTRMSFLEAVFQRETGGWVPS